MKEFKIEVPEGYKIDTEKSTFELIVFKEINQLPQRWEELGKVSGAYIGKYSEVISSTGQMADEPNTNMLPTRELAEAMLALCQLLQLRDRWNGDWKPDWTGKTRNVTIVSSRNEMTIFSNNLTSHPMVFKSRELAEQFLDSPEINKLLQIAKPLL